MISDDDLSVVNELHAGFDKDYNLIVCLDHGDYDDHDRDYVRAFMVIKSEAEILAKKLFTPFDELPQAVADHMHLWGEIVNAKPGEVEECQVAIEKLFKQLGCNPIYLELFQ